MERDAEETVAADIGPSASTFYVGRAETVLGPANMVLRLGSCRLRVRALPPRYGGVNPLGGHAAK